MADLSDIEVALVGALIAALYPNGTGQACSVGSPVRVYRGWPLTGPLASDLALGTANVSVFSVPGSSRNTTRWGQALLVLPGSVTLTVNVFANTATFGGVVGAGQVAGLLVDGIPYVYRAKSGDTTLLVAAILGEAIRAQRACTLIGAALTVPGADRLIGRVVADGSTQTEWTRQSQGIRVSAWCPNPSLRDAICSAIGSAFAATPFLNLRDGSSARVRYRSSESFDDHQDAMQYRRDLVYDVEYGTTSLTVSPSMLFPDLNLGDVSIYS